MCETKQINTEKSNLTNEKKAEEDGAEDDLDAVLTEIGEFSLPQIWKYVWIFIPIALSASYAIGYVVSGSNLEYRCRVPECDLANETVYSDTWLKQAIPHRNNRMQKCVRYATNVTAAARLATSGEGGRCPADIFDRSQVVKCDDFVFKTNEHRLIREFGIYCEENEYKLALVGTINSIGGFLFMPLTGILSDKFGRLTVLVVGMTGNSIFGIIKAFSANYSMYMTFEFLDAAIGTCTYMAAFVLSVEWVSTKYRVLSSTVISLFYPIGEILIGLLAMHIPTLRTLLLVLYVPGLLIFFYYWLIPESVRWLLVTGRRERALEILKKAATANHKELSQRSLDIIQKKTKEALETTETLEESASIPISSIFRSRVLVLRLLNCSFCWIVCAHVFYGLSLSSTKIHGDDNKYLSFIVVVFAEIPGALIAYYLLDRLGRRSTLCAGLIIAGVATILSPLIPPEQTVLVRIFFFTGMCSISCAFSVLYIFTAEIWPTNLRNTLMNICSMLGRIGTMLSPLTPLLAHVLPALPFVIFGGTAILSGLLVLMLPETLKKKLPDTVDEAISL